MAFATSKDVVTRKTFVLRSGRNAVVEIGPLLAIGSPKAKDPRCTELKNARVPPQE